MTRANALLTSSRAVVGNDASPRTRDASAAPRALLGFLLLLFLLSCVFDPADTVLSLKVWLFMLCWAVAAVVGISTPTPTGVPHGLAIYTLLFILVPSFSILWFFLSDGSVRYEGFGMLKGYVLITLAPMLVISRVDLLPRLCSVLTLLALGVIGVFVAMQIYPALYAALYILGPSTGILYVDNRSYGSDLTLLQVYFVTSPMLAISIAYYFDRARSAAGRGAKVWAWALVVINVSGMLLAGTRNNILVSIMLPTVLAFLYARNKALGALLSLTVAGLLVAIFAGQLAAFFDPTEVSNSAKLSLLDGYARVLSDPVTLMFGRGLGAYETWDGRGEKFVTELTYLEVLRNFGLIGAVIVLGLLLFPIWHAFAKNRPKRERASAVGFAFYLLMCVSNPNLFSSMGILILSVLLANIFSPREFEARR